MPKGKCGFQKGHKGFETSTRFKKGQVPWNKGLKGQGKGHPNYYTDLGEKHHAWKGESAGYAPKHQWNIKHWGNPISCAHCGKHGRYSIKKNKVKIWNIQWANKSGKYLRERNDWIGLCRLCHEKYDSRK